MTDKIIVRPGTPDPLAKLSAEKAESVRALIGRAWSESTRRAYAWGWKVFEGWCVRTGLPAIPAEPGAVAAFIDDQVKAGASASAIQIQLSAIAWIHDMTRVVSPTRSPEVKLAWKGAVAVLGLAPKNPKAAATLDLVEPMIDAIDRTTVKGKRDAAIILLGFYSALRRSNIAALRRDDITNAPGGIAIRIRKSKTDQAGRGETIGVKRYGGPFCAVAALEEWIAVAPAGDRLFPVSARTVASIVQRRAKAIGLDAKTFGGHSLRAGFVTEAFRHGASDVEVMGTTTHRNATHLARYRREADPVARGASGKVRPSR